MELALDENSELSIGVTFDNFHFTMSDEEASWNMKPIDSSERSMRWWPFTILLTEPALCGKLSSQNLKGEALAHLEL